MSYVGEFAIIATTIWFFLNLQIQKRIVVGTTICGNTVFQLSLGDTKHS